MAESTNNTIYYNIKVDTETGKMNIDGLTSGFVKADKAVLKLQNDLAKGANTGGKSLKGLGDASGSATSSVMELSRVVSDAPYGIRGMANNITQLVSQMGTATVKAGSLSAAVKLMWKAMMGPLGIVFAITAVVSALDYFKGGMTKAKKSTQELTKEVFASGIVMNGYVDELDNVTTSEERRVVIIQELTKAVPTLTAADLEYGANLDEVRFKIKQYTLAQASRMEMDKLVKENSELLSKQMRIDLVDSTDNQEEKLKMIKGLLEEEGIELEKLVNKSYSIGQKTMTLRKKTNSELVTEFKALALDIKKESDPILERINRISQGLALDPAKRGKNNKGKKEKRAKATAFDTSDIIKDAKKYVDEVMKMEKKNALLLASNNVDKLIIEREFQLRRISRLKGDNSALIAEYTKYYDTLIKTAEKKLLGKSQIDPFAPRDLNDDAEKIRERQRLLTEIKLQALADSAQAVTGFLNGEFQREIDIEKNKTNALNNELNKRLLNENLSKDERKRIQLQIGANDEKLRIKQEQIEKKRFKLNKAANIAQATIATYLAAAQVMANPLDLNPVTKGIAMASTIAMGLANVATIARQKFQSSAGSGGQIGGGFGGGSGGGGNDRDFNFNLAGTSQQNQLSQVLQGRFDQPLQAYVVSTDITNQQQLDQEILGNATFG